MEGITGGSVLFGKTVKTGDYENEKAEVRLDFNEPELLDKAGELAKAKTLELLGKKTSNIVEENGVIKRKPGRPPIVVIPAEPAKAVVAADPAAIDVVAAPQAVVVDPAEDLLAAAPTTITDADLVAALNRKVAATKNAIAIKQVIGTFVAPPKSAKDIPQEKRAEFLAKIEAL